MSFLVNRNEQKQKKDQEIIVINACNKKLKNSLGQPLIYHKNAIIGYLKREK
jgi:hypothetical protein